MVSCIPPPSSPNTITKTDPDIAVCFQHSVTIYDLASSEDQELTTGNLALSRALGDFEFKQNFALQPEQQIVTADPDITTHKIDGEEEFLVVACDGECGVLFPLPPPYHCCGI
jgi:hypothetical protein